MAQWPEIRGNYGSGTALVRLDIKPLPEQMLIYHQRRSVVFTREQFYNIYMGFIRNMRLEIALLKKLP